MALNLTNLFTALGRCGRNAFIINGAQDIQETPFTQLAGFAYINPSWIASLSSSYDAGIRAEPAGMQFWMTAAQSILQGMVAAENPAYGTSLGTSLLFLYSEMKAQTASVKQCAIGATSTPDAANVGNGSVLLSTVRGDGLSVQNTVPEETTLLITSDSFTGGATAGLESWQWAGAPNVSSFGTGQAVGVWDFDFPQGSGATVTGACISASTDADTSANLLTNGDTEAWTGSPAALDNWNLVVGTWGTSIRQDNTSELAGTFCVEYIAGATLNELTQQFNSTVTSGATAGTAAALTSLTAYGFNVWLKAAGVISGGVMTVDLVDAAGVVYQDKQGVNQTATIALTGHSTNWTPHAINFRTGQINSADVVRLRIRITTALAGANLFMEEICFSPMTQLYPGGPFASVYSNPAAPFEAGPDPDGFTFLFTNDYGGSTFRATFQALLNKLFRTPDFIAPYDAAPTIADTLITNA